MNQVKVKKSKSQVDTTLDIADQNKKRKKFTTVWFQLC